MPATNSDRVNTVGLSSRFWSAGHADHADGDARHRARW